MIQHLGQACGLCPGMHRGGASLPWDGGVPAPNPHIASFPTAEHPLPTPAAELGSRRCQGMESRSSAAMGETANSFSCGMQRRRYLIPPLPPPLSNTHQPPAQLLVQGGLGFFPWPTSPSKGHLGFRPARASPCLQVIAVWLCWTRSRARVRTEHSDHFYCWGTLAGWVGAVGAGGAQDGRGEWLL